MEKARKKQYLLVKYWVEKALKVRIVMTIGCHLVLSNTIFNQHSKTVFTSAATQVPHLLFYKVKVACLRLVWTEYQKFSAEDMSLKDKTWATWQALLGFEVGAKEDVEGGGSTAVDEGKRIT